jgi:hypothetical protein
MIELSVLVVAFKFALGIADADRIGASAKALAANPINKRRFMKVFSPWVALSRWLLIRRHSDCSLRWTRFAQMPAEAN